ncbi:kelch repeat protein [Colletotrichum plurivorum]|uniref:Kelch repeat protein n=1 Tax=Colletotrichum plurivorum TaxID=2175906 RepID=A0A8H6J5R7_9PEZI|nr:kelch repeat protein [Colletotrichum plurivorum]
MEFPTFLTDESSNCSYAWGGRNAYNFSLPHPFKYWRLCIKKKEDAYGKREQAEWEEVDSTSADQLAQLTPTSHSAFVSTPEVGFIFGGKEHKEDGSSSNAPFYRWFNFTSKESREYENPPYTSDSTLWGATAVYVPDFGPNGLVFILGGVGSRDQTEAAYVGFENLHFMDPITRTWYKQTATSSGKGFPYRRHQHCAAGLPGANGTYDIYIFGGANDDMRTAFSDVHVLSLPSFTWNFVAEFPDAYRRQGHACAIAGNSQLLSWGGLPYHTSDEATSWELEDPLPQGVGVFDLNRLSSLSTADLIRYDASAKSYRAEESLVAARPTSVEWSSPEVAALFARTGMDDTSADPRSQDESNTGKSTKSVGIIVGAVVGGLVLIAVAAAAWWFFIVRKRRSTKPASKETPSSLDDKRSPETKPAELQDPGKPAEMTGGSEAVEAAEAKTQPVHEMEGDPANRP